MRFAPIALLLSGCSFFLGENGDRDVDRDAEPEPTGDGAVAIDGPMSEPPIGEYDCDGVIALFHFNGDVDDECDSAAFAGTPPFEASQPTMGMAVSLDGATTLMAGVDTNEAVVDAGATIDVWVRADAGDGGPRTLLTMRRASDGEVTVELVQDGETLHAQVHESTCTSPAAMASVPGGLPAGQWTHVTTTFNTNGQVTLSVFGIGDDSAQQGGGLCLAAISTLIIGGSPGLEGAMDELRLRSGIHTPHEVP